MYCLYIRGNWDTTPEFMVIWGVVCFFVSDLDIFCYFYFDLDIKLLKIKTFLPHLKKTNY